MTTGYPTKVLNTKTLPPQCAGLIERPRLFNLLPHVQAKQLTVIKAAAGFGKTSLAAAWVEGLKRAGEAVAWLSLDADDDEPARFLFYVCHALRQACDHVGESAIDLILERSQVGTHAVLSMLINDSADIASEIYLFMDDYHLMNRPAIHDALLFLIKRAPTNFHLVLTSRSGLALPLGRQYANNQLFEVDASTLAFDLEETQRFVVQERLGGPDLPEIRILHAKTEGWPALMRIVAATCLQSGQDFRQYVQRLSGTVRPIGAYLAEMLDGLPAAIVQFMLRTAILDQLSVPLCRAVTGAKSSGYLLESIESRQLLLTPLDQEGQWYRYHHLLSEHLKQRLETELPDQVPKLHRRAAEWYASREIWTDAVHHAIAAGDMQQAINWVENCAMELVKRGDMLTLLGWQRRLPALVMRRQLKLRIAIAWGMALAMQFKEALEAVEEIEQDIVSADAAAKVLTVECQAIRSVAVALADDSQNALMLAEACLKRQPTDAWIANVASNVARFGYWKAGDLRSFRAMPWISHSLDEDKRNVFASVYRLCLEGLVDAQQLRLSAAERCYLEAMQLSEQHVGPNSVAGTLPASLIALICYEKGKFDQAEALVIDRLPIISAAGMLECAASAYIVLARTAIRRMNTQRAEALLRQAQNLGNTRKWGRLIAVAQLMLLQLYLAEGRATDARTCLDRLDSLATDYSAPTPCAWSAIHYYAALGRALWAAAEHNWCDAIGLLRELHHQAAISDRQSDALSLQIQLSLALHAANETTEASKTLCAALTAGASTGIYQTILDQGPAIGPLLLRFQENAQRTGAAEGLMPYVSDLIVGWRERYQPKAALGTPTVNGELLSVRERKIIELIAQGQSNKEIARRLGIAPETVKSHVKHIFTKLDVEKRAQAVSRAQSLGLVRTH